MNVMRAKKRYISILLAICLVAGILSMTVTIASNRSEDRAIMPGASGIEGLQADSLYFGTYLQSSDGSEMGYNVDPIKWRALSNGDGKLFLLADQILDMKPYYIKPDTTKWGDSEIPQTWEGSTLRQWMNGEFFNEAFNSAEQSTVLLTKNQNADNDNYQNKQDPLFMINDKDLYNDKSEDDYIDGGNPTDDRVFALSINEAVQYFKGDNIIDRILRPNQDRVATNTAYAARGIDGVSKAGEADMYWLRSPGSLSSRAAVVNDNGDINEEGRGFVLQTVGVRPAINVSLDSVLFTSAAIGGKAEAEMEDGIAAIALDYKGSEWKATILDESHQNFSATILPSEDGIWQVSYTGAAIGTNEYISVMIEDVDGAYTHYGRVKSLAGEENTYGELLLDLTDIDMSDKTLHVFNEQYNGDKMTDYASQFVSISNYVYLPGFKNVTTSNFYNDNEQMPDIVTVDADADEDSEEIIYYYPTLQDMIGSKLETLDRVLLSLKVDFVEEQTYSKYTGLWIAGNANYQGFRIYPQNSEVLRIDTLGAVQTNSPVFYLTSDRVGSMAEEFILQLSFEYGDFDNDNSGTADDVKVGAYINGELCTSEMDLETTNGHAEEDGHMVFYNCDMANLGTGLGLFTYNRNSDYGAGDLTVSAFVPKNNELTQITWSDFRHNGEATKDQAFVKDAFTDNLYSANLNADICDKDGEAIDKLGNTSFEARLTLTHAYDALTNEYDEVRYGGSDAWRGLRFYVGQKGQLILRGEDWTIEFEPDVAKLAEGTTFLNQEFSLKITTEYADYNGDGSDDVQFGFYFNDRLYNNQYCYVDDYQSLGTIGNFIGIIPAGNAILVRSASNTKAVVSHITKINYMDIATYFSNPYKVGDITIESFGSAGILFPGDYEVKDAKDNVIGSLILYKERDAHPDKNTDVKDLVAMLKIKNGMSLSTWSGTTGACVPGFDLQDMINTILE